MHGTVIVDPHLDQDTGRVLAQGEPVVREVCDDVGRSFIRRVDPHMPIGGATSSVIVTYEPANAEPSHPPRMPAHEWQTRLIAELGQHALASRDLAAFLDHICASLIEAFACDHGKILKLSDDRKTYELVAGAGFPREEVAANQMPIDTHTLPGFALNAGRTVLVRDFEADDRIDGPAFLRRDGLRSGMSTIIQVGGKPWGVISLYCETPDCFSEDDLSVLESVANIAAMTIMQAAREEFLSRERIIQSLTIGVAEIGVWTMDVETRRVAWDNRFRRITGLVDAIVPFGDTEFVSRVAEEDRDLLADAMRTTIHDGEAHDVQLRFFPPGGEMMWLQVRGERIEQNGREIIVGIVTDITERKSNEERNEFMMRELDHRVKNLLAIILSIAEITSRTNTDVEGYKSDFRGRLESMARTHSLLAQSQWSGLNLRSLVAEEILSFTPEESFEVEGPAVTVAPTAAQSLAMFLHELTANAFKHGALSVGDGRVKVSWDVELGESSALELRWQEAGGPPVHEPAREGFGSKVINRIIKRQLDAEVMTHWNREGIELTARIPLTNIVSPSTPDSAAASRAVEPVARDWINGKRVLVVDDEWLVAEQHAKAFASLGAQVCGPYLSASDVSQDEVESAHIAVLGLTPDLADDVMPLADRLTHAQVRTVFLAKIDAPVELPERFRDHGVLYKPASIDALIDMAGRRAA